MSDNGMLDAAIDPDSCQSETAKSDRQDDRKDASTTDNENLATENQTVSPQDVQCNAVSCCTEDETVEVPTKETTASVAENAGTVNEIASESVEKTADDNVTSVKEQNERSDVLKIQEATSIGAGNTCLITEQDGSAGNQKLDKRMIALAPATEHGRSENEKSIMDNEQNSTDNELTIAKLKKEVRKAIEERDTYQEKLKGTEKKLFELQTLYNVLMSAEGNEVVLHRMVYQLKTQLIQTSLQLEDRIRIVSNQEKQITALNSQVSSLKEVESLTKSLLQIRNMEVKHLQAEVDDMEVRISEERERYNTMINKMDAAVKLNADLKKEYETQLCLFRDLREKYEEKVSLLSEEKRALEANVQTVPK